MRGRSGLPAGGGLPPTALARRRTPQAIPPRLRSGPNRARTAPRHSALSLTLNSPSLCRPRYARPSPSAVL